MNLDAVDGMMEAAREKAREIGKPVCVVIVDAGGDMVALRRFEGAAAVTVVVAQGKAMTSAYAARESGTISDWADRKSLFHAMTVRLGGMFMPLRGGVPILEGGVAGQDGGTGIVVGAIGTSGALGEEDELISKSALSAYHP